MRSRKALALSAFLFFGIGGTGAKADPILTPIIAGAIGTGGFTIAGAAISYASLVTFAITSGGPHAATSLRAPK